MKHTPGPWRKCGGATPHYTGIHSKAGYIVYGMADNCDTEHGKPIKCPGFDEQRANARLIAAAPEMLELLKLIVDDNEMYGETAIKSVRLAQQLINEIQGETRWKN